jgi:hypothetical protein
MTRHDAEVLQEYAGDLMKRNGPHASQIKGVARALPYPAASSWRRLAVKSGSGLTKTRGSPPRVHGHDLLFTGKARYSLCLSYT